MEIAQLVECLTEKPGAVPKGVRVPGAARDFSPRVNFQNWVSDWKARCSTDMVQILGAARDFSPRVNFQNWASDWKARCSTDGGLSSWCSRRFFPRVNFQRRLLRCPYSTRVQSHTSMSVCTLKIPNAGSHTIVWTHKNTTHTDRNG